MNILDLKKGDEVYGGLTHSGNGFATHVGYRGVLEVRSIILRNGDLILGSKGADFDVRLSYSDGRGVVYACELHDASIYATEEDFLDGNAIKCHNIPVADVSKKLATACGLKVCKEGYPEVWEWDGAKKEAKPKWWVKGFNLADPKLPDGCYATKGECERANRKTIKVAIHREDTRIVEVPVSTFDEALDWVDDHIDQIIDNADDMDYMVEEVTD